MIWVFPMAGYGTRVATLGKFKPFIKILNKPIVSWLLQGLKTLIKDEDKLVFITTKSYEKAFNVKDTLINIIRKLELDNQVEVKFSPQTPNGPAASVYLAKKEMLTNECISVVNTDQLVFFDMPEIKPATCYIPVHVNFSSSSSYVEVSHGNIVSIAEKKNLSNIASAGVYIVSNGFDFVDILEQLFYENNKVNNEFYVATSLNYLIKKNYNLIPIAIKCKFDLGSTKGVTDFEKFATSFF